MCKNKIMLHTCHSSSLSKGLSFDFYLKAIRLNFAWKDAWRVLDNQISITMCQDQRSKHLMRRTWKIIKAEPYYQPHFIKFLSEVCKCFTDPAGFWLCIASAAMPEYQWLIVYAGALSLLSGFLLKNTCKWIQWMCCEWCSSARSEVKTCWCYHKSSHKNGLASTICSKNSKDICWWRLSEERHLQGSHCLCRRKCSWAWFMETYCKYA